MTTAALCTSKGMASPMTTYRYSLPGALALFAKALMLGCWQRSPSRRSNTPVWSRRRCFRNNGLLIGRFAVLVHPTIRVAYDEPPARLRHWLVPLMYGYVLCIAVLLAGSSPMYVRYNLAGVSHAATF